MVPVHRLRLRDNIIARLLHISCDYYHIPLQSAVVSRTGASEPTNYVERANAALNLAGPGL